MMLESNVMMQPFVLMPVLYSKPRVMQTAISLKQTTVARTKLDGSFAMDTSTLHCEIRESQKADEFAKQETKNEQPNNILSDTEKVTMIKALLTNAQQG